MLVKISSKENYIWLLLIGNPVKIWPELVNTGDRVTRLNRFNTISKPWVDKKTRISHIARLLWSKRYSPIVSDSIEQLTRGVGLSSKTAIIVCHRALTFGQGGRAILLSAVNLEGSHQTVVAWGRCVKDNQGTMRAFDWAIDYICGAETKGLL